jgi:CRISPR-associated endoribonuclease Cas6
MERLTVSFSPISGHIDGRYVTARGLHGLLFNALKQADPDEATWLHGHPSPKPYSMAPLYTETGHLAGLRLSAVNDRAVTLISRAWSWHEQRQTVLRLGRQEFTVARVHSQPGPTWLQLARSQARSEMTLDFLSPTAFKQGPGHLTLPLPRNVFDWPVRVWQVHGPPYTLPADWHDWCEKSIFITDHQIHTASVNISQKEQFTGFVGRVTFTAHEGSEIQLAIWQALGQLAAFCGVGHKTTMGLGAVGWCSN